MASPRCTCLRARAKCDRLLARGTDAAMSALEVVAPGEVPAAVEVALRAVFLVRALNFESESRAPSRNHLNGTESRIA